MLSLRGGQCEFFDGRIISGLLLHFDEVNNAGNLLVRNISAVNTGELGCARWNKKHVSGAEKFFRSLLVNDCARVNFGRNLK